MRIHILFWVLLHCSFKSTPVSSFVASHGMSSEFLVRQHVTLERQKRYLLYPNGDPARIQLIIGLGVPVDLEDESVTIGYVIKILYHVPQVPEDYSQHMFDSASIVRAFNGHGQHAVMMEGNYTTESILSTNTNLIRNASEMTNGRENFKENNGCAVGEMNDEVNTKKCSENNIVNEEKSQNYENYEKIELDPIIKDYFVPKYGFVNTDKNNDEQSVNKKDVEGETVDEDKEYLNELKSGNDNKANEIRRKRDSVSKNANFIISNKDKEDVVNGGTVMNTEGETIRDEVKNNDGYTDVLRVDLKKGGLYDEDGDEELIRPPKTTRWGLYKVFENMLEQKGYEGRACMLRTICEAAETPFTHKNGVLGELVHILLTPSTTQEMISHSSDKDYHTAEKRGLMEGIDCEAMYPDCEESILEMFSEVGFDHLFY